MLEKEKAQTLSPQHFSQHSSLQEMNLQEEPTQIMETGSPWMQHKQLDILYFVVYNRISVCTGKKKMLLSPIYENHQLLLLNPSA